MAEPVRARRLTDAEGQTLQRIVRRGKHDSIRVRRALIIMASASGTTVPAIAQLVKAHQDTVRDVIHACNQLGLDVLDPRWAGGRPRRISPDEEAFIVAAAKTRPERLGCAWKESTDPLREVKLDRIEHPAGALSAGARRAGPQAAAPAGGGPRPWRPRSSEAVPAWVGVERAAGAGGGGGARQPLGGGSPPARPGGLVRAGPGIGSG